MERVFKLLEECRVVGFATVDEKGIPHSRIFELMDIVDDKIYFITASGKKVYKQMLENPYVAFTAMNKDYVALRVEGKAMFIDDEELKQSILNKKPSLKSLYSTDAAQKTLKVFYIEKGTAEIFDLSSEKPKKEKYVF